MSARAARRSRAAAGPGERARRPSSTCRTRRSTAPVSGISGRAEHSIGTLITTDAAAACSRRSTRLTPIWVRFSLARIRSREDSRRPPGRAALRRQCSCCCRTASRLPGEGPPQLRGDRDRHQLGTQQLRAEFDNPKEQLLPGQFVTRAHHRRAARQRVSGAADGGDPDGEGATSSSSSTPTARLQSRHGADGRLDRHRTGRSCPGLNAGDR